MRPVSTKFLNALHGSHRASVQAFVVASGQTGTSPTGTEVPVFSGNIQLDGTRSIRGLLDMETDGTGTFPDNADDLFAPYGNEIFIRRGIAFGGGSLEWISLGYFRINSVEQEEVNGALRVAASDRMVGIVEARLLSPVQFASTDTYGSVVDDLITEVYPWATIEWDDATDTDALGRSLIAEEERYDFLNELVTSRGKIWYWDHRGVLVIKDVPPEDEPVWEVSAGANGVLVSLSRELSRDGVYNAVVASGEALDDVEPSRAVAKDMNPASPTFWDGDFGHVPRFYVSPFITTNDQAQSAANALLRQKLGLPYSVDLAAVPNPALEPWDAVTINAETHIIETLTIPLVVTQGMNATTREQTLVIIGEG